MITAVLLAGGSGTRLWPLSRHDNPKQFLSLFGKKTMLQQTVDRLSNLDIKRLVTVCNEKHRFLVAEQLREIDKRSTIILEPEGRNTAPAITLAALSQNSDSLLLVMPSDHIIKNKIAFTSAIEGAVSLANSGVMVTFGVKPNYASPQFGYIKFGKKKHGYFEVEKFTEKPDIIQAKKFVKSSKYLWNSGYFLFRVGDYLNELNQFSPEVLKSCEKALKESYKDLDFQRLDEKSFMKCPNVSIDKAIFEKTNNAACIPFDVGWSDVGSWASIWSNSGKDKDNNVTAGDVITSDVSNSYIRSEGPLVAASLVDDLIIVATKDSCMVTKNDDSTNKPLIASLLSKNSRRELKNGNRVNRPWGNYEIIDTGDGYQVKRIIVQSKGKLSLQLHKHRAEHWVVVSGVALVTKDKQKFILSKNESIYIPAGVLHRLENKENEALELIEVQSGDYLGEDDIIRYHDDYGRS